MMVDEFPQMCDEMQSDDKIGSYKLGGNSIFLNMYFDDDFDAFYKKAIDEGVSVLMPLSDVFWGDRYGQIKDPFGQYLGNCNS